MVSKVAYIVALVMLALAVGNIALWVWLHHELGDSLTYMDIRKLYFSYYPDFLREPKRLTKTNIVLSLAAFFFFALSIFTQKELSLFRMVSAIVFKTVALLVVTLMLIWFI